MGRRSRKRAETGARPSEGATRAERDVARRARAARARAGEGPPPRPRGSARRSLDERPPPLWGSFPLTELLVLAGIVLMAWGFVSSGSGANATLVVGLAVASMAGLELAVREHVTGFRSHSTLLAGVTAVVTTIALGLGVGLDALGPLLVAGVLAFGASFLGLRELFRRRSGGVAFR